MSTVCLCQELVVHSKKRKFDHQYFVNNQRRRPRDLDPLAISQSQSFDHLVTSQCQSFDHLAIYQSQSFASNRTASRDADYYREPVTEDEEPVGAPVSAEDYYEPSSEGRYEETPEYDNMAGDPSRIAIARRGKLVTFYRNGDPHYKVANG